MIQAYDCSSTRNCFQSFFQLERNCADHRLETLYTYARKEWLQWLPSPPVEVVILSQKMCACNIIKAVHRVRDLRGVTVEVYAFTKRIIAISSTLAPCDVELAVKVWITDRQLIWVDSDNGTFDCGQKDAVYWFIES